MNLIPEILNNTEILKYILYLLIPLIGYCFKIIYNLIKDKFSRMENGISELRRDRQKDRDFLAEKITNVQLKTEINENKLNEIKDDIKFIKDETGKHEKMLEEFKYKKTG